MLVRHLNAEMSQITYSTSQICLTKMTGYLQTRGLIKKNTKASASIWPVIPTWMLGHSGNTQTTVLCKEHEQMESCALPKVTLCESLPMRPREKLTWRPHNLLTHPYINRGSFEDLKDVHMTLYCNPTTTPDYLFILHDRIWWSQDR